MSSTTNHVRILHTSDWQLGMGRVFLGQEAGPRFTHDRLVAVRKLLELARAEQCEAVVVAGDVFDSNFLKPEVYQRTLDVLEESAVPVFLLPGNHDPLDAASVYRRSDIQALQNVTVLGDSQPVLLERGSDTSAVRIVGAPMLSKHVTEDLVSKALGNLEPPQDSTITVLVGHGAAVAFGAAEPDHISIDAIVEAYRHRKVDYVALGDTHSTVDLHGSGMVWYSGAPEVTDYREYDGGGESDSGNVLIVDIELTGAEEPANVDVRRLPVGTWKFQAIDAQVDSLEDAHSFIDELLALPDKATTAVKYALVGTVDLHTHAWLEAELEKIAPKFAALYPRESREAYYVRPSEEELTTDTFGTGVVGDVVTRLAEMMDQGDHTASDALNLLYRLKQQAEKSVATTAGTKER